MRELIPWTLLICTLITAYLLLERRRRSRLRPLDEWAGRHGMPLERDVGAIALAQLEPLPQRVLMVGDRSHDVEGAAQHGIGTVVVDWGYGGADFPDGSPAVAHVGDIAALREVLNVRS